MTANEMLLFSTALLYWTEHRQGGELADAADVNDGIERISEVSRVQPTPIELATIISIHHEMLNK